MDVILSYKAKIKDLNHCFVGTVHIYNEVVSFFLNVCDKEWSDYNEIPCAQMESLTLVSSKRPSVPYDFNEHFYKMSCYLRRAAINEALGIYSSWYSNHENWVKNPKGKEPKLQLEHNSMPAFYKGNMYKRISDDTAQIKIYHHNDWVWQTVHLRKQDVKYIQRHCSTMHECSPVLAHKGKCWYLSFAFEQKVKLNKTDIKKQKVCAVDLGLNNDAVCSVMDAEGTVIARRFIRQAVEKDHLYTVLNRIRKQQQHGARHCKTLWSIANNINREISRKTAGDILSFAYEYNTDVIVFEHLDTAGKKKGKNKQKLSLWRKKEIQRIVEHRAHRLGVRTSRICARNTSRLAYDGSGYIERGRYTQNGKEKYNYSICIFRSGKQYHCDLNASYNIGARYFIRELLKSDSVRRRLPSQTKDSDYGKGTTRTLSSLIKLNTDFCKASLQTV